MLKENSLDSIAFPLVNTERKGYPKEQAAHIAIRERVAQAQPRPPHPHPTVTHAAPHRTRTRRSQTHAAARAACSNSNKPPSQAVHQPGSQSPP